MADLSTTYLGRVLANPLVPSASPLARSVDNLRRMEDAGAAAVVLPSLFEEQIEAELFESGFLLSDGMYSYAEYAEALAHFPSAPQLQLSPDRYLEHVMRAKGALGIPVIASLNGVSNGAWIEFAKRVEKAGADALELNLYWVATDPYLQGSAIEQEQVEVLRAIKSQVKVPVAVKLSPYVTNLAEFARRLDEAGADGLVLFSRFAQPDIELDQLAIVPTPTLTGNDDGAALRLPLNWISILDGQVKANLAASGGVHSVEDVVKLLLVGADITMMASSLMRSGIDHLAELRVALAQWLDERDYASVQAIKGNLSRRRAAGSAVAYERAQYIRAITTMPKPVNAGGRRSRATGNSLE